VGHARMDGSQALVVYQHSNGTLNFVSGSATSTGGTNPRET